MSRKITISIIYNVMQCLRAENKTRWTQHDNDTRLDVRIGGIHNWMDTLSKTLQDTEEEIDKVRQRKMCACIIYIP